MSSYASSPPNAIRHVRIERDGLSAGFLNYGARLQELKVAGHSGNLVLGYSDPQDYLSDTNYFGATIGRVANRIAKGQARIDGVAYHLDRNTDAGHQLHGGRDGTANRYWEVAETSTFHVVFETHLADGHMGYPGNLLVQTRFEVLPERTLSIEITATTDTPTLCNFAHHSYFNLGNAETIEGHRLQVFADHYLPTDHEGIPAGEMCAVAGTEFDLRDPKKLDQRSRFDNNFCLSSVRQPLRKVARLVGPDGRVTLSLSSTDTGLQVYTGHGIVSPIFGPLAGVALEPQGWPDAVHHEGFPEILLRAGQQYHQRSHYQFVL